MESGVDVLVIDDDPTVGELLVEALERADEGFSVTAVPDAERARARVEAGVDCVVVDYELPDTTGVEFLEEVRRSHPALPVIVFTGQGSEAIASEAIAAGATDYLRKDDVDLDYDLVATRIRNAVEKERAEAAAAATERRLETLAEHSEDILYMFGPDWAELRFVNSAYEDIWGRSIEALEADPMDFLEGVHPDDRTMVRDVLARLRAGESTDAEYRVNPAEDYSRWVWVKGYPVFDEDEIVAYVGFARDVTERKARERAREELNVLTRQLLQAETPAAAAKLTADAVDDVLGHETAVVRLLDEDGRVLRPVATTEAAEAMLGERPPYAVGQGPPGRAFEADRTVYNEDVSDLDDGVDRGEARASIYVPIGDVGVLSIGDRAVDAFDAWDRQLAETLAANAAAAIERVQLLQARKRENERLEELTSVVSHDLRNPLDVLKGSIDLRRREDDPEHLDRAERAVDRMDAMIDDLLTLARQGETVGEMRPVHLGQLVEDCWTHVQTGDAALEVSAEARVLADPSRLQHLVENLVGNAVEHGGDRITVDLVDDGFVVADDGPGIPPADREAVFEPGHSTAEDGTGFGLAIVRSIAEAHDWRVAVGESDAGGARFVVTGVQFA